MCAGAESTGRVIEEALIYAFRKGYYRNLVATLGLGGGEVVLDLGCGGGAATRQLAAALPEGSVIALDPSTYWLGKTRRRLREGPNVDFVQQDMRRAPIPEGSLDVVLIHYVLHDIPPADRGPTVLALARGLRPGGRVRLIEPVKPGHGIAPDEVIALMGAEGLRAGASRRRGRSAFEATFVKGAEDGRPPDP